VKLAQIFDGRVHAEATEEQAAMIGVGGKPMFDIRDVSSVADISIGWIANADGSFSAPPAPAAIVPSSVTSAQAKIQLLRTPGSATGKTLLDDVTAAVQAKGGEINIWFTDARTWDRNNPYVAQLGSSLKLNAATIDGLFTAAAQISA
jgi:hypothetical protein